MLPLSCRFISLLRRLLLGSALVSLGVGAVVAGSETRANASVPSPGMLTRADDDFLEELSRTSFRYFVEQAHPVTGLVNDRARTDGSTSSGVASIAASGFAFASWAVAVERGWVEREDALIYLRRALRFLLHEAERHEGFFYHFMDAATGARVWSCELSSIDTALLIAGAVVAREALQDPELTQLVNELYAGVNWRWFLNGGRITSLGWKPVFGFSRYRWFSYSEHMLIPLLGLGTAAQQHRLEPAHWRAWTREPVETHGRWTYLQAPPLFIHQFSHAFFDFRDKRDAFADYYRNSVFATLAQREMSIELRAEFPAWGEELWGVTASDSATGYKGWGLPPWNRGSLDGTIVPCAAAGSLPFAPAETLQTLRHMRSAFPQIWGRYGFADAFNPHTGWVAGDNIGIDIGITILMAENARSGRVWSWFMQAPEAQRAMAQAGFLSTRRELTAAEANPLRALARELGQSVLSAPGTPEDTGLRLTALLALHQLNLLPGEATVAAARRLIDAHPPPTDNAAALAQYAASLLTARQALPELGDAATQAFAAIDWEAVPPLAASLGSADRLAAFFQVAASSHGRAAWERLERPVSRYGDVTALTPHDPREQVIPGLWLDERAVLAGASAAQLAHALTLAATPQSVSDVEQPTDPAALALMLVHFPAEVAPRLVAASELALAVRRAPVAEQAVLLIALANVLEPEGVRHWFQQDPIVQAARAALPEFREAPFGPSVAVVAHRELAERRPEPPPRTLVARRATQPHAKRGWEEMETLEFRDSVPDVYPGDPALSLRFAFTWDEEALHFHAEAFDTPPGYQRPKHRNELVELYIDLDRDGLTWGSVRDLQFTFHPERGIAEHFHDTAATGHIRRTKTGYTVDVRIPWSALKLAPHAGLELDVSPAILRSGPTEFDPVLKLNWRFHRRLDGAFSLATLRLE